MDTKIKKMIPSYGQSLVNDIGLMRRFENKHLKDLELNYYENK